MQRATTLLAALLLRCLCPSVLRGLGAGSRAQGGSRPLIPRKFITPLRGCLGQHIIYTPGTGTLPAPAPTRLARAGQEGPDRGQRVAGTALITYCTIRPIWQFPLWLIKYLSSLGDDVGVTSICSPNGGSRPGGPSPPPH